MSDPFGDIDKASSNAQVKNVYKPSAAKDKIAGKDIDEGHGGINVIAEVQDGAAGANTMTTHSSTANTAEDMGIS